TCHSEAKFPNARSWSRLESTLVWVRDQYSRRCLRRDDGRLQKRSRSTQSRRCPPVRWPGYIIVRSHLNLLKSSRGRDTLGQVNEVLLHSAHLSPETNRMQPPVNFLSQRECRLLERLSKEVKQRAGVVGIFPNEAGITRLIGAVLLEHNDKWLL